MKKTLLIGTLGMMLGAIGAWADDDDWRRRRGNDNYRYDSRYDSRYDNRGYDNRGDDRYDSFGPARYAPPPPRREYYGRCPSPRHVWVPGYYAWRGNGYGWNNGYWAIPPRPRAVYVPGYWRPQRGVHVWIGGFWR